MVRVTVQGKPDIFKDVTSAVYNGEAVKTVLMCLPRNSVPAYLHGIALQTGHAKGPYGVQ